MSKSRKKLSLLIRDTPKESERNKQEKVISFMVFSIRQVDEQSSRPNKKNEIQSSQLSDAR